MSELQGHQLAQYSCKVYGRMIIQRVINESVELNREEQRNFQRSRK